jgi:hypothetical protein
MDDLIGYLESLRMESFNHSRNWAPAQTADEKSNTGPGPQPLRTVPGSMFAQNENRRAPASSRLQNGKLGENHVYLIRDMRC